MTVSRKVAASSAAGLIALGAAGLYAGSLSTFASGTLGAGSTTIQASCTTSAVVAPGVAAYNSSLQTFAYTAVKVTGVSAACAFNEARVTVYNSATSAVLATTTAAHVVTSVEATAGEFQVALATPVDASLTPTNLRYGLVLASTITHDAVTGIVGTAAFQALNVSWTAPVDNGGVSPNGYKIEYAADASGSPGAYSTYIGNTYSPATNQYVYGLTAGVQYWIRITAWNVHGLSASTTETAITPGVVPYTYTSAPTGVSAATGATSGSLNVSWTIPGSNGFNAITGYRIEVTTQGSYPYYWNVNTGNTGSTGTTATITGLAPGQNYWVRVSAINAAGPGPVGTTTTYAMAKTP